MTIFNTLLLLYWINIWYRSYRVHRDNVSLIVLLFVAQSLIREIWSVITTIIAISGLDINVMVVELNTLTRIVMAIIFIAIHYLVRNMKRENETKTGS